jgi:hypothetical protein
MSPQFESELLSTQQTFKNTQETWVENQIQSGLIYKVLDFIGLLHPSQWFVLHSDPTPTKKEKEKP